MATNVQTQIERIQAARNEIRDILGPVQENKSWEITNDDGTTFQWQGWGIADGSENITELAELLATIPYRGAGSFEVVEGASTNLPRGFYTGGTITGKSDIAGDAEKYKTQEKTITPSKSSIAVKPDTGYYALSSITVNPIPAAYQDVSATTATAATVLDGYKFTNTSGTVVTGSMVNNGAVSKILTVRTSAGNADLTYTIPAGYHNGKGTVSINKQSKSVTPTKSAQSIIPDAGYVLNDVQVAAIPAEYITTTDATATAAQILSGATAYVKGSKVTGTMANYTGYWDAFKLTHADYTYTGEASGSYTKTQGLQFVLDEGYYDQGSISLTLGERTITPSKSVQTIYADDDTAIGKVVVSAIPSTWFDVSGTTAAAAQVLTGYKFVNSAGTLTSGTMTNNNAVSATLNTTTTSYTVPAGYHNGSGKVSISLETKSVTPTTSAQTITPTAGKVLSSVTVAAIPADRINTDDASATAANILSGLTAYVKGEKITGTMANFSAAAGTSGTMAKITPTLTQKTIETAFAAESYGELSTALTAGYYDNANRVVIPIERKSITPTKAAQEVWPTDGYVLGEVYVQAIPAEYITTTDATATAAQILSGATAYVKGSKVTGSMADQGAKTATLNTTTTSYTIPAGYHNGQGKVSITTETKSATPTKAAQTITPTSGKVLASVTVAAIPAAYQDVSATTADAASVLSGKKFTNTAGTVVTGTMANNGATSKTLNALTQTSVAIAAGYTTGGSVTLTADLENALAAI